MADKMQYGENDPRHHTAKLKQVMIGLQKAYQDFEDRNEQAWKGAAG